jgi:hypothetical protein
MTDNGMQNTSTGESVFSINQILISACLAYLQCEIPDTSIIVMLRGGKGPNE